MDKQDTQFIFGQFVDCFENKMYIVKSLPGFDKQSILEIYSLNESLFQFMRLQEIKMDINVQNVSFNNEGTMILTSDSSFYYLGISNTRQI